MVIYFPRDGPTSAILPASYIDKNCFVFAIRQLLQECSHAFITDSLEEVGICGLVFFSRLALYSSAQRVIQRKNINTGRLHSSTLGNINFSKRPLVRPVLKLKDQPFFQNTGNHPGAGRGLDPVRIEVGRYFPSYPLERC